MQLKEQDNQEIIIGGGKQMMFGVDTSTSIIFDILRNKMYSNKVAAVAREIASNARDANREAGTSKPVEIEFTTNSVYMLGDTSVIFRDYGYGISPERMETIFLMYAASTKRDNNEQTGGFGLGAKTPFAYTDSFIVKTVNEGIEYVYNAIIDSTGKGKMILIKEDFTDRESGTEIIIPILTTSDRNEFEREIYKATRYWDNVEYINFSNQKPSVDYIIETPDYSLVPNNSWGSVIGLLDGIPYEIKPSGIARELSNYTILIHLDIDQVTINANRESLQYDEKTREHVDAKYALVKKDIKERIETYLSDNDSYKDAYLKHVKLKKWGRDTGRTSFEDMVYNLNKGYANDLGLNFSVMFKGEAVTRLNLKHHTLDYVKYEGDGKSVYEKSEMDTLLPFVYLDKGRISVAKNSTLGRFMLLRPIKASTCEDIETELKKIQEVVDGIQNYSDVKADTSGYVRTVKDTVTIKVRKGLNSHVSDEMEFDKKLKELIRGTDYAFIPVDSISSLNWYERDGAENKIRIVQHVLGIKDVYFVNRNTYERHLKPNGYQTLAEAFQSVDLTQFSMYRDAEKISEVVNSVPRILMENFPDLLPKKMVEFKDYNLKVPENLKRVNWESIGIPISKFNYEGLREKYRKNMKTYYPMVLSYITYGRDNEETTIKNIKQYVTISNCNKR